MDEEDDVSTTMPQRGSESRTEFFRMRLSTEEKRRLMERARQCCWGRDETTRR